MNERLYFFKKNNKYYILNEYSYCQTTIIKYNIWYKNVSIFYWQLSINMISYDYEKDI